MKSPAIAAFALGTALLTAPNDAIAAPRRTTFALVVANNRSPVLNRPELKYADDDGVKYAEVFETIASPANVYLLTELDSDSAKLFPRWNGRTRPPTKAGVKTAAEQIAATARKALDQGDEVDFYFVFAGHGDRDQAKGFIELRDAPFNTDEVEALLKSIPTTHTHVIVDSCNSYFVLNARKAGGSRAAISEDARKSLSKRLPNVGVFLSTSAEAKVYEWSELQGGIFSHAVRSGLLGGADVNHDGNITYDELSAFVGISARNVKNPNYRPNVFAHGPNGQNGGSVFHVPRAKGPSIKLPPAPRMRLTLRDAEGLPWIDVHKEEGAELTLHLPQRLAESVVVEESEVDTQQTRIARTYEFAHLSNTEPLLLAEATPSSPSPLLASARGPDESLRLLFAAPFGPRAMAAYKLEKREEPIYGVSLEDVDRMRLLLAQVSRAERDGRWARGGVIVGLGGILLAGDLGMRLAYPAEHAARTGTSSLIWGSLNVGLGLTTILAPREGENLYPKFVRNLNAAGLAGAAHVVARTELELFDLARWWRGYRLGSGIAGGGVFALSMGMLVATSSDENVRELISLRTMNALNACTGLFYVGMGLIPTPVERMAELWRNDPGRLQLEMPSFSITPTIGLGHIGVHGTF